MARAKQITMQDKGLKVPGYAALCAAECIGTAILVFLGCLGCVGGVSGLPTHLTICLGFGIAVMISIQNFGHISGGHINPVVTVAAVILGHLPIVTGIVYFVGQFIGALLGYALVMLVTPSKFREGEPGLCSPYVSPQISSMQGLMVEFLISLVLVLVCCSVWDVRNSTKHDSVPIKFGLTIAGLAIVGGPYTGGNMNPVRSFAPALFNRDWANHWVYWLGPLLAAVVGSVLYRFVFSKEPEPKESAEPVEVLPLK